jgi:hypothetical protein
MRPRAKMAVVDVELGVGRDAVAHHRVVGEVAHRISTRAQVVGGELPNPGLRIDDVGSGVAGPEHMAGVG